MKKPNLLFFFYFIYLVGIQGQELPIIPDHAGTFEILSRTNYASLECGFTKAEMTANLQKISELVGIVRKNPVLSDLKGFDSRARIYNTINCRDDGAYGVPSRISFEFADWFRNKDGTAARILIEPPEWSLIINKLVPIGHGFSSYSLSTKPDYFTIPNKKETTEPGIDVYDGECYVVYKPDQPDYWLPVTVKEAFDVVFEENRKVTDQIQRDFVMKYLNEEWNAIPQEDWNKPATLSGMISRVGTNPDFPPIMKVNPAYWDKNRPKSDIQFIYFRMVGNKAYLKQRVEESKKQRGNASGLCRFEESLDIDFVRSLKPLVKKMKSSNMKRLITLLFTCVIFQADIISGQNPSDFFPEKPGKWMYSSNIKRSGAEVVTFNNNLAVLCEWFHQNVSMLYNPKGYDLDAWVYPIYDDTYKLNKCNYAMRAEVNFKFQLFYSNGGKWTIEPPHFEFYINNTEAGHGTNSNEHLFDAEHFNSRHPDMKYKFTSTDEKAINDAVIQMNGVFAVFPFVRELASGVNYYDCEQGGSGAVVVFNPERPDFWIPVTLRELANMHLDYYTSTKDEFMLPQLKKEIAELSEEELNAPAFTSHDTHFVLKANGKNKDLQLMRFNPEYWDESLPPSAIQFMTFLYGQSTPKLAEEHFQNNGYPNYSQKLLREVDWKKLAGLIKPN